MSVEYFIANKLFTTKKKNISYSKPILRIAILAIALSVSIMLLSVMIVNGFKHEISSKVIGFGSHITISKHSNHLSYNSDSIDFNQNFIEKIKSDNNFKHLNIYANKTGIIKIKDDMYGVILKGVSSDFDWSFFKDNLIAGDVPKYASIDMSNNESSLSADASNEILISEFVSNKLDKKINDYINIYFVPESHKKNVRAQKFKIKGIYNTSLSDFDQLYVISDIKQIQYFNRWPSSKVGGFELSVDNFKDVDLLTTKISKKAPLHSVQNIKQKAPQIYEWLDLQDINVRVIIILMLIVGLINIITCLLIIVIEKTRIIGIFKAIGLNNWSIRKVFIYVSLRLVVRGIIIANFIAFLFAFLQKKYSVIKLNPKTYFMDTVPIEIDFLQIILLNIGTLIICYLVLLVPSLIITKISPSKAIKFE